MGRHVGTLTELELFGLTFMKLDELSSARGAPPAFKKLVAQVGEGLTEITKILLLRHREIAARKAAEKNGGIHGP